MKVLLKEDVENLGLAGEVHKVAPGYGRNYLIPRGLAETATPDTLKKANVWRARAEARRAQVHQQYAVLAAKISGVTLEFTARAGESGKLYGSVTSAEITERLNSLLGIDIDRHKVETDPLRQLGEHKVSVRLDKQFQPELTVLILPLEAEA